MEAKAAKNPVNAVAWDVSRGFSKNYLGKFIFYLLSSTKGIPQGIYHVAILAFGNQYEFGDGGIDKKENIDLCGSSKSLLPIYRAGEIHELYALGKTSKSLEEFESWINNLSKKEFRDLKYCMSKNNCAHWAKQAGKFLDVGYPEDWDKLVALTEKNYTLIKAINKLERFASNVPAVNCKLLVWTTVCIIFAMVIWAF